MLQIGKVIIKVFEKKLRMSEKSFISFCPKYMEPFHKAQEGKPQFVQVGRKKKILLISTSAINLDQYVNSETSGHTVPILGDST